MKPPRTQAAGYELEGDKDSVSGEVEHEEIRASIPSGFEHQNPLISGLFQQLPSLSEPFTSEDQEQWLTLATHILKTVWPSRERDTPEHWSNDDRAGEEAPQG